MSSSVATPIDRYLSAQADLRAVERFARADVSGRTGQWDTLIPLSAPGPGEQYRFEVDLDACTGCKACVTACHSLNGLDETESFRSIGLLVTPQPVPDRPVSDEPLPDQPVSDQPIPEQTVTTACHHCVEPGCLIGCPAEAYEKDPVTGIVKHLDDACIGCQYCTLTCPYDVPVFNDRLGIVRKCDLCADRLADGEAPACVQGCPTQAISVATVAVADLSPSHDQRLVPGAAPSALTTPTTVYRGRLLEDSATRTATSPADTNPTPQHAHLPLVVMLVLSQWSVGVAVATALSALVSDRATWPGLVVATALGAAASGASFLHLGQPLKAWRVVLGWSHSWLSREAIAIGVYVGLAAMTTVLALTEAGAVGMGLLATASVGLMAVFCSAQIYVVTGRHWWRAVETGSRFAGTTTLAAWSWLALTTAEVWALLFAAAAVVFLAAKIRLERSAINDPHPDAERTAALLRGPLRRQADRRVVLGLGGAGLMVLGALISAAASNPTGNPAGNPVGNPAAAIVLIGVGSIAVAVGELFERRLFFAACAPSTMPGAHR